MAAASGSGLANASGSGFGSARASGSAKASGSASASGSAKASGSGSAIGSGFAKADAYKTNFTKIISRRQKKFKLQINNNKKSQFSNFLLTISAKSTIENNQR